MATDRITELLADEIYAATDYYRTYVAVAKRAEASRESLEWCLGFWTQAIYGLRDGAIVRLARVYDRSTGALSLSRWLKHLQREEFKRGLTDSRRHCLERALAKYGKADASEVDDADPLVKRLKHLRDKHLSHRDLSVALNLASGGSVSGLTLGDVSSLLTRAQTIYNRYAVAAFNHEQSFEEPIGSGRPEIAIEAMDLYVASHSERAPEEG